MHLSVKKKNLSLASAVSVSSVCLLSKFHKRRITLAAYNIIFFMIINEILVVPYMQEKPACDVISLAVHVALQDYLFVMLILFRNL